MTRYATPPPPPPLDASTQPNTSRDAQENPPERVNLPSYLSSTTSSPANDIQPTWPRKVSVTGIPSLVSWQSDLLGKLFLDIDWITRGDDKGAFFKIHTRVRMSESPTTGRVERVSVFLFLAPERIRTLSFTPRPKLLAFGADTVCLDFELYTPPALVLPKKYEVTRDGEKIVMQLLRSLATQTSFSMSAELSPSKMSASKLKELCTAVSAGKLPSIDPTMDCVRTLYQGAGGCILEGASLATKGSPAPPIYNPVEITLKRKKRRLNNSVLCEQEQVQVNAPSPRLPNYSAVSGGPRPSASYRNALRVRRFSESDAKLSWTSQDALPPLVINRQFNSFKTELEKICSAQTSNITEIFVAQNRALITEMTNLHNQLHDTVNELVNDKLRAGFDEVEDHVMEQLTTRPVTATFTFPDHPHY